MFENVDRRTTRRTLEYTNSSPGLEVINLEFILKLKMKHVDWLLADTCPQAANHCALFSAKILILICPIATLTV